MPPKGGCFDRALIGIGSIGKKQEKKQVEFLQSKARKTGREVAEYTGKIKSYPTKLPEKTLSDIVHKSAPSPGKARKRLENIVANTNKIREKELNRLHMGKQEAKGKLIRSAGEHAKARGEFETKARRRGTTIAAGTLGTTALAGGGALAYRSRKKEKLKQANYPLGEVLIKESGAGLYQRVLRGVGNIGRKSSNKAALDFAGDNITGAKTVRDQAFNQYKKIMDIKTTGLGQKGANTLFDARARAFGNLNAADDLVSATQKQFKGLEKGLEFESERRGFQRIAGGTAILGAGGALTAGGVLAHRIKKLRDINKQRRAEFQARQERKAGRIKTASIGDFVNKQLIRIGSVGMGKQKANLKYLNSRVKFLTSSRSLAEDFLVVAKKLGKQKDVTRLNRVIKRTSEDIKDVGDAFATGNRQFQDMARKRGTTAVLGTGVGLGAGAIGFGALAYRSRKKEKLKQANYPQVNAVEGGREYDHTKTASIGLIKSKVRSALIRIGKVGMGKDKKRLEPLKRKHERAFSFYEGVMKRHGPTSGNPESKKKILLASDLFERNAGPYAEEVLKYNDKALGRGIMAVGTGVGAVGATGIGYGIHRSRVHNKRQRAMKDLRGKLK